LGQVKPRGGKNDLFAQGGLKIPLNSTLGDYVDNPLKDPGLMWTALKIWTRLRMGESHNLWVAPPPTGGVGGAHTPRGGAPLQRKKGGGPPH